MKKCIWMLLGLLAATGAWAAESRVFALATAGDVEFELADRVRTYLQEQSGAAVRIVNPVESLPGQSLEAIGRAAAKTLKADEFGIVVLARPDGEQPQGVCLPDERFGILNVARLGKGASEDQTVRRAGQDGLRVMSMLLGMSACPFPLCVLTGFEKTEDLDHMSGNYCPPCQDRFNRLARDAGVQLIEPSPAGDAASALGEEASVEEAVPAAE